MAKYTNRNRWRQVYGHFRRTPNRVQYINPTTGITESYDLNTIVRFRDYFEIQQPAIVAHVEAFYATAEYEEGLIWFIDTDIASASFQQSFSASPFVVLTMEPEPNDRYNVIPHGLNYTVNALTISLSSDLSGAVRYRAIYSPSYPAYASSSFTASIICSAGAIAGGDGTCVAGFNVFPGSEPPWYFIATPWDDTGNGDSDIYISESQQVKNDGTGTVTSDMSSEMQDTIHFITYF